MNKIKMVFVIFVMSVIFFSLLGLTEAFNLDTPYTKAVFLNQDPDPAEPGKYVELRWKITKYGNGLLEDVTYEILPEYPFSLIPGSSKIQNIGTWSRFSGDDEHYILYYKLKVDSSALEHDYKIKLRSRDSKESLWSTQEYTIRVGDSFTPNFVLGNIISNPRRLVNDIDDAEIIIDFENIGNGDAELVTVEIELPLGFDDSYTYSTRKNLGTILAGEGKSASFYFDIENSIMAGNYDAYAIISYKDKNDKDNEYRQSRLPFVITVMDKPQFEIEKIEFLPSEISAGMQDVIMKINLKNIGGKEGESISVRAFKESSQPFEFDESSDYIGKISALDNGEAVLKFFVKKDAVAKNYNLDLEVRYIHNNEVFVERKNVVIPIQNGVEKKSGNYNLIIGILIAVAIASLIGYYFGKRKKD
jgi:hypothetical protein